MPIDVENIHYYYFKKTPFEYHALKGVSFHLDDHFFIAFIGATGSGKSTLIQHLNGLLTPESGQIKVDEYLITNNKKKNKKLHQLKKHVGVVFQFPEYQLFEETVEKDVAFGPKNFKVNDKDALELAHNALKSVGLDESYYERSPFELSGGEKRRVAIAGILALNPDILILDEPTAGLDNIGKTAIMNLLLDLYKQGKSIILVSHDMDLVNQYCDEVFVMEDGNLIKRGKPKEVFLTYEGKGDLQIPKIYEFCRLLKENGKDLDINKINSVDDLVKQLLERMKH